MRGHIVVADTQWPGKGEKHMDTERNRTNSQYTHGQTDLPLAHVKLPTAV